LNYSANWEPSVHLVLVQICWTWFLFSTEPHSCCGINTRFSNYLIDKNMTVLLGYLTTLLEYFDLKFENRTAYDFSHFIETVQPLSGVLLWFWIDVAYSSSSRSSWNRLKITQCFHTNLTLTTQMVRSLRCF